MVTQPTRARVMRVVARRYYVAHGLAGSLASGHSRQIGVIIPTIANSIYASSTQAIKRVAQQAGYTVVVGISEFSPEYEVDLIHRFLERRVEGLVLTGAARDEELYKKILRNGVKFMLTWKLRNPQDWPAISFDNYLAGASAAEHLIELGHRRIGLICGRSEVNDRALERRRGFEDTLRKCRLKPDSRLIFERDFEFREGGAALRQMLAEREPPTAIFAANDIQAVGVLYECRQLGLRVPEDISVVGFDDLPIAEYVIPQLTTVHVPSEEMGRYAAESLIAAIRDGRPLNSIELPTRLVIRGSSGPPRQSGSGARRRTAADGWRSVGRG
jgi:LacI family transcriptional regulator